MAWALSAWLAPVFAAGPPGGGPPPAPVVVAEARKAELAPMTWVAGTVASRNDARIAAELGGRLTWVAEVGERVKAGETLARLDDTTPRLKVSEYEAEVAREQARLKFLEQEARRLARLAQENNAARTRLEQTESERDVARSELAAAEARLSEAREQLRRSTVPAPFVGVVAERARRAGEWVGAGDEILRLVDTQRLEVVAFVPMNLAPYLSPGMTVTVRAGETRGEAKLRAVVPVGDARSRLMELRLDVSGREWRAGAAVRLALPSAAPRQVLAVPRDALVLRREGAAVFRVNGDETAERVAVNTGAASGELIEVSGELRAGDRVVIRGGERMRPGQKVRILPGAAAP